MKNSSKKKLSATKIIFAAILSIGLGFFVTSLLLISIIVGSVAANNGNNCGVNKLDTETVVTEENGINSAASSLEKFVKDHEKAYIEAWKVGGFLPSASIAQTQVEVGFNMNVPSFGQAHNMGGVKWSKKSDFKKTIELYGEDAVSNGGAGTDVGDATGGSYVYFKDFDAGIVGKAEFMANQTLYVKAINNTDGIAALEAIADGGWATDTSYKETLRRVYQEVGSKFKWLDEKAIAEHGEKPVANPGQVSSGSSEDGESDSSTHSSLNGNCWDGEGAEDGEGEVPAEANNGAWGYLPDQIPDSLKPYVIDPKSLGMEYGGGGEGWYHTGRTDLDGQCVNLTVSLGNKLWGHSGSVYGNGIDQAGAWASIFGNSVKKTPRKGAIFSNATVPLYGHTGIVSHVFKDGSLLIVEQNTPLSGWDTFGKPFTWNYRIVRKDQLEAEGWTFAYPDDKKPNLGGNAE